MKIHSDFAVKGTFWPEIGVFRDFFGTFSGKKDFLEIFRDFYVDLQFFFGGGEISFLTFEEKLEKEKNLLSFLSQQD